jgi:nucleoid-associated protein YgaU
LANEPYAHLEAVAIDEIEEGQKVKKEVDDSGEIPLKHFDEQVTEIKDILSEINALNHTDDDTQQDSGKENTEESVAGEPAAETVVDQVADESDDVIEQIVDKPADKKPKEKRSKSKDRKKQKLRAESMLKESKSKKRESSDRKGASEKKSSVLSDFEEKARKIPASKSRRLDLIFIGVLAGGLLIYLAVDHKIFTTISRYIESYRIQRELAPSFEKPTTSPESQDFDASQSDFGPDESVSPVEDKSHDIGQSQADDLEQLFNQARSYHDFIATEEVIPGSRLTRIAERHYGVKEFWVYIYEANRDILESPAKIEPGMLLKIPRLNPVLADKDNPRCIEYALKLQEEYLKD